MGNQNDRDYPKVRAGAHASIPTISHWLLQYIRKINLRYRLILTGLRKRLLVKLSQRLLLWQEREARHS